jgi:plastocyanin
MIPTVRRRRFVATAALAALAVLVACGAGTPSVGAERPTRATTNSSPTTVATVVIDAFVYLMPETVRAGEPITVRNDDHADHTLTADDGSFSVFVAGDDSATLVVTAPGTYPFYCRVHPDMRGVLQVV